MKISIASDHAGFDLKEKIKKTLIDRGFLIKDFGAFDANPIDYVDTGILAAEDVAGSYIDSPEKKEHFGILICGTGQGMNMIANKVKGIRASLCLTPEFARLARQHNDANVLVLAGRYLEIDLANEIVETFLNEPFSEEIRHKNRIEKIIKYENIEVKDGKNQTI